MKVTDLGKKINGDAVRARTLCDDGFEGLAEILDGFGRGIWWRNRRVETVANRLGGVGHRATAVLGSSAQEREIVRGRERKTEERHTNLPARGGAAKAGGQNHREKKKTKKFRERRESASERERLRGSVAYR